MSLSTAKTILLGHLDHDPVVMAMPGQAARIKELDDLLASIPAQGLLQSLKVRISNDASIYLVTAGNRRLATLRALRDAGGEIRGVKVTDDYQVPVVVSTETDDSAREQAVAENVQRVALTPGAEARQYAEMAKHVSTKDIAARFGVTEKRVKQRLALAGLHDDVLAALDVEKITLAAAQAFTLEPDPEKQAAFLKTANKWDLDPASIKRRFTQELVNGTSPIARLIGLDAYLKAGGQVLGDAFDSGSWWTSPEVIDKLRDAHWEKQVAAWCKQGWSFVMSAAEFGDGNAYMARWAPAIDREGDDPTFTPEQMARSGVVYWPDASSTPRFGVLPKGTKDEGRRAAVDEVDLEAPGGSINTDLRHVAAGVVAAHFRTTPLAALQVLVATLHATAICSEDGFEMPIQVYGPEGDEVPWLDDDGEPIPDAVIPPQGRNFAEALAWAAQQPVDTLLAYLAERVADTVDLSPSWSPRQGDSNKLLVLEALGFAPPFEAPAFFSNVSKAYARLAWQDMTGEKLKAKKGDDVAQLVADKAVETGWLPPTLRTAAYAGPAFTAAAEADNDDDDAEDGVPAVAAE